MRIYVTKKQVRSNGIPVFRAEDAKDIAKMRR